MRLLNTDDLVELLKHLEIPDDHVWVSENSKFVYLVSKKPFNNVVAKFHTHDNYIEAYLFKSKQGGIRHLESASFDVSDPNMYSNIREFVFAEKKHDTTTTNARYMFIQ